MKSPQIFHEMIVANKIGH